MIIEQFNQLQYDIEFLIELRNMFKFCDSNYEDHLKTLNNNIHNLQIQQDKLLNQLQYETTNR